MTAASHTTPGRVPGHQLASRRNIAPLLHAHLGTVGPHVPMKQRPAMRKCSTAHEASIRYAGGCYRSNLLQQVPMQPPQVQGVFFLVSAHAVQATRHCGTGLQNLVATGLIHEIPQIPARLTECAHCFNCLRGPFQIPDGHKGRGRM